MLRRFYNKFDCCAAIVRTMNTSKKSVTKTLAAKLSSKTNKIVKPTLISTTSNGLVPDIEDIVSPGVSRFFSPIQTRQQRRTTAHLLPNKLMKPSPPKKARQTLNKEAAATTVKKTKEKVEQKLNIKKEEFLTKASTSKSVAGKVKHEQVKSIKSEVPEKMAKCGDWAPSNWESTLENIRNMRQKEAAPVDTMGCHQCADNEADQKTQRFQKLVALMLSSQTKDETTFDAMKRLKAKKLSPTIIIETPIGILETLLCPVSFYRNKAKYLKQTAKILIEKYDSDIPNNVKELIALPGVGPKMAHICMATAWNEITGIGVDVHVHRIANRLEWVPRPTKEPEQTRQALESWLPKDLWAEVNHLFVGFGQTTCTPLKPKCEQCSNLMQCPAAPQSVKNKHAPGDYVNPLCPALAKFEKKLLNLK